MGPLGHSLSALAAALGIPLGLAALLVRPDWRVGLDQRLGAFPAPRSPVPEARPVWVHGASVGEIRAALGIIDGLRGRGLPVVGSTTTVTGLELLQTLRPGISTGLAPLDHPWCAERALREAAPCALVLMETELWPCWIAAAHRLGIPVVSVSSRLSDRSFRRYRRVAGIVRPTLQRLAAIGARSEMDAERFLALGAPPERVSVTGDLKLELPALPALSPDLEKALAGDIPILAAGSTHEGEEQAVLGALAEVEARGRAMGLVLAPRHLGRRSAVAGAVVRFGRRPRRRTELDGAPLRAGEVLILDTLGELAPLYARVTVAFVGGTLVPLGGHNLLEPLHQGRPVLFGPHTENVRAAAELLTRTGAGRCISGAEDLAKAVLDVLADPAGWSARTAIGRAVLDAHRGATHRTLDLVSRVCESGVGGAR